MKLKYLIFILVMGCAVIYRPAQARWSLQLDTSVSTTQFLRHRERHDINQSLDLSVLLQTSYDNGEYFRLQFNPRISMDAMDASLYHYVPDDAYVDFYGSHAELKAGLMRWPLGVAESHHPTDILNRQDLAWNYYDPEKLGDWILAGTLTASRWGFLREPAVSLLVMPFMMETPLPGSDTRFSLSGSQNGLRYSLIEPQEKMSVMRSMGVSLLASAQAGPADVQMIFYHGPEHDPGFRLVIDDRGALRLRPFYYDIDMVGLNVRIPAGHFVFKAEAAFKYTGNNAFVGHEIQPVDESAIPDSYAPFVVGADYTFENVFTKGEIRVFAEFLGEDDMTDSYQSFRPFKRDVAVGLHWNFNDARSTTIMAVTLKDLATRETIVKGDFSTAIYKTLRANATLLYVWPAGAPSALAIFDNNSFVTAGISYAWGKAW